jgi:hypothetical protein
MIRRVKTLTTVLFMITLITLLFPQKACAYIDLGTGSYIFQIIIAFFIGGIYAIKQHIQQIKFYFKKLFTQKKPT